MSLRTLTAALVASAPIASAYDVFAHYMIQGLKDDHASRDVQAALDLNITGFALNVGNTTAGWSTGAIKQLFDAAADTDFKLFFSLDTAQEDNSYAYMDLIQDYYPHSAYYKAGSKSKPVLSTFQSGGRDVSYWSTFLSKIGTNSYFLPMFDETDGYYDDPSGWMSTWGSIADGLFSWETAWPGQSNKPSNVSCTRDEKVISSAHGNSKSYMMPLSTLQYKRWSGQHYYRTGETNLPERMTQILSLEDRPEFVQIQTWNDAGEGHYMGQLWEEGLTEEILSYANEDEWSHAGWQGLIKSFNIAYKTGADASGMRPPEGKDVIGAMWYRTLTTDADCRSDTMGPPDGSGAAKDAVNWAVVVGEGVSGYKAQVWSAGVMIRSTDLSAGLNYFSAPNMKTGGQYVEVVDGNNDNKIIISGKGGKDVKSTADGICTYNYQVTALS
ncbi:glycoside hydrolase [Xylariomycetidae sp. FL2044]|nr:glycoside hydrolase [Xylariomycetidae sp. FL2044]